MTIALNKVDLCPLEQLTPESKQALQNFEQENPNAVFMQLSCNRDDLVEIAKNKICQELLDKRLSSKANQQNFLTNDEDYYRGVTVVQPKTQGTRKAFIPQSVIDQKEKPKIKTLRDYQEEFGGAGVFSYPLQEHFSLAKEEWKYDAVPEIMNGKNIFDFVDPDIERKIMQLEKEQADWVMPEEELLT